MKLSEFWLSFARKINLPGLELDHNDYCEFTVDDMPIHLQGVQEKDDVLIYGDMGALPAERDESFFLALLQMNYLFAGTRGGTIAYQKDSDRMILQLMIHSFSRLEESDIYAILDAFVNSLEKLREFVDNYRINYRHSGTQPSNGSEMLMNYGIRV